MLMTVQGTTPRFSSSEVQHCTALMATSVSRHPVIDHGAELGHFQQRRLRERLRWKRTSGWTAAWLRRRSSFFHACDATKNFREIEGLDGDAAGFENLFAVAHGVERRGPRADSADAQVAQAVHDSADAERTIRGRGGTRLTAELGVQSRQRIGDAVLREIVAGRHFAAKTVAAVRMVMRLGVSGVACTSTGT